MKKRWRTIGIVMSVIAAAMLVISGIGFVNEAHFAPMYNTSKTSVDSMLNLSGSAWNDCPLVKGVETSVTASEAGTYKQGLSTDDLYLNAAGKQETIRLDVIDGQMVIDNPGELTIFVIGNRKVQPFVDEETGKATSVSGYTTIPSADELAQMGVTVKFDGTDSVSGGKRAKPYAMGLKANQFSAESTAFTTVNFVVIDGCLTLDKEGEQTVTVMGEFARYEADGAEHTISAYTVDQVEGVTVAVAEAATSFAIFAMRVRMLFLIVGAVLLVAGLLYAFFPENAMVHYILKRLGQSLLTIALVVSVVFLLMRLMPTEYYFSETELIKLTEQQRVDKLQAAGLLDPPLVQLGRFWVNALVRMDLGTSHRIQSGVDVVTVIGSKLTVSMEIGLTALMIALIVGVVLGILQARFKDGVFDHVGTAYTIFINAVPSLVSYTLVLAIGSRVFGAAMRYSSVDPVGSSILPVICLSMGSIASYMLWMRRYMVDELNKEYIRLAKLKGLSTTRVMFRHVMKNAFLPLAQYLPYNILLTLGGSLLVERFFSVPGLGPLLTDAIGRYDCSIVQAIVMFYAVLGIFGVFIGDLLMTLIDPRISLTGKGESR